MFKTTEVQIVANDIGEDLHLHIDAPHDDGRTAFIQHGLTGSITDDLYLRVRKSYLDNGWNCVAVECTNSLNGAGGNLAEFTVERHVQDVRDAIEWAIAQGMANDPFALAGHSMGGHSVLRNAAHFGKAVDHVISSGPVTTGQNLFDAWAQNLAQEIDDWRSQGRYDFDNFVQGSLNKGYIPFDAWGEWKTHDIATCLNDISSQIHFVVGEDDNLTMAPHVECAYKCIADGNEFRLIEKATHCYPENLDGFEQTIRYFINQH